MALPGSFAVTEGGAATYEIPIEVPPGTAGVEPKLSLTYSSNGGNGLLGVGWALSGLSQISRCARTVATDGQHGGVNYDANDRFCLNGDRLVAISGTYGADGTEYRTQSEGFSRIISHGTAGNGPASFTVWTKAGLKMAFGVTADSRIEAQGKTTVRLWALSQVTDTVGNFMTVTYTEEPTDGSYRPDRIDYTGNTAQNLQPYASVRFVYEPRAASELVFQGGAWVINRQRLVRVEVFNSASAVSSYEVSYEGSPATARDRITSIQMCSTGASPICLTPSSFAHSDIELSKFTVGSGAFQTYTNLNGQDGSYNWYRSSFADFDGDGQSDIFLNYYDGAFKPTGYRDILLSNGDGTFTVHGNPNAADGTLAWYEPSFADFNGDGKSDIFFEYYDGNNRTTGQRVIWLSNGDGSFSVVANPSGLNGSYAWYEPKFGDFDGDGYSDIFYNYLDGTKRPSGVRMVWQSNGDGTFNVVQNPNSSNNSLAWYEPFIADFNGDGRSDIFFYYYDVNQRPTGTRVIWLATSAGTFDVIANPNAANGTAAWYEPFFGDFNGDGLADILYNYYDSNQKPTGTRYIWTSKGDGSFLVDSNPNNADGPLLRWYEPQIADFNGDGRSDIFYNYFDLNGVSTGYSQLWLSVGNGDKTGFYTATNFNNSWGSYNGYRPSLADFNGDGRADVFYQYHDSQGRPGLYRAALFSKSDSSDAVVSVSNGLGSTSEIDYASLAAFAAPYEKDAGTAPSGYPTLDLQPAATVVSEVRADDGVTGVTTTRYRYGGLKYDYERRQSLGFRWREVEQVETGVVKRTEYYQDFPYIGRVAKSETRVPSIAQGNGGLVRTSESNYLCEDFVGAAGCEDLPGRRQFVYQSSSVEKGWDLDGTPLPQTTTTSSYDGFGNATSVNVSVFDPSTSETFTKTTNNTYLNPGFDAGNDTWILGRLTRAEVTSTSP